MKITDKNKALLVVKADWRAIRRCSAVLKQDTDIIFAAVTSNVGDQWEDGNLPEVIGYLKIIHE